MVREKYCKHSKGVFLSFLSSYIKQNRKKKTSYCELSVPSLVNSITGIRISGASWRAGLQWRTLTQLTKWPPSNWGRDSVSRPHAPAGHTGLPQRSWMHLHQNKPEHPQNCQWNRLIVFFLTTPCNYPGLWKAPSCWLVRQERTHLVSWALSFPKMLASWDNSCLLPTLISGELAIQVASSKGLSICPEEQEFPFQSSGTCHQSCMGKGSCSDHPKHPCRLGACLIQGNSDFPCKGRIDQ